MRLSVVCEGIANGCNFDLALIFAYCQRADSFVNIVVAFCCRSVPGQTVGIPVCSDLSPAARSSECCGFFFHKSGNCAFRRQSFSVICLGSVRCDNGEFRRLDADLIICIGDVQFRCDIHTCGITDNQLVGCHILNSVSEIRNLLGRLSSVHCIALRQCAYRNSGMMRFSVIGEFSAHGGHCNRIFVFTYCQFTDRFNNLVVAFLGCLVPGQAVSVRGGSNIRLCPSGREGSLLAVLESGNRSLGSQRCSVVNLAGFRRSNRQFCRVDRNRTVNFPDIQQTGDILPFRIQDRQMIHCGCNICRCYIRCCRIGSCFLYRVTRRRQAGHFDGRAMRLSIIGESTTGRGNHDHICKLSNRQFADGFAEFIVRSLCCSVPGQLVGIVARTYFGLAAGCLEGRCLTILESGNAAFICQCDSVVYLAVGRCVNRQRSSVNSQCTVCRTGYHIVPGRILRLVNSHALEGHIVSTDIFTASACAYAFSEGQSINAALKARYALRIAVIYLGSIAVCRQSHTRGCNC